MTTTYKVPTITLRIIRDSFFEVPVKQITCPGDIATILIEKYADLDREMLVVIHTNTKNKVTAIEPVAIGSLNEIKVAIREIFKGAIVHNTAAIVLGHNHPSGIATPSPEDVRFTKEVAKAGELLGVQLLDHIVVGHGNFVSMKERGLF